MQQNKEYTHIFEDLDDWFDFIFEDLRIVVRNWTALSKVSIKDKMASREVLRMLIDSEFEDVYDNTRVILEDAKQGKSIEIFIREKNKENGRRRPI